MKNKKVHIKEPIDLIILRTIIRPFVYFKLGYRIKNKYKIKKGESVVILSNHQTDYDPIIVRLAFNRYIYTLATDNIFAKKSTARFITRLGGIPKRKGLPDLKSLISLKRLANSGGSLLIFPEGNRSYAEFQYNISGEFAKWIASLKSTIVIFNINGGFGSFPRFGTKRRKGKFTGEIKKVLKYEEYSNMSSEELQNVILENLKVFDSDSGNLYKSNKRAEYLERMFFACPKCSKANMLVSNGNYIKCNNCGLEVEYKEDLKLDSNDEEFRFKRLVEWYDFQKEWMRDLIIKDNETIFKDEKVELYLANPYSGKKLLDKGNLSVNTKEITIGNTKFNIEDIETASPVSGRTLCVTINGDNYVIRGNERFNSLKYVFLFHKLETKMKLNNTDKYYSI